MAANPDSLSGLRRGFLSSPEEIIDEARNGRMFILVDDEDRENEGDLVIPAQMATPEKVNFMARHGRGLICLAMTRERVDTLGLPLMSPKNGTRLDRDGEGGFVPRSVLRTHQRQAERVDPLARHGEADEATPVPRHEVDLFRRRHLGRDDQVALILPVLVIDQDEHTAVARLVDDLFGAGQETAPQTGQSVGISGHDNAPCAADNGRARRSRY